MVKKKKLRKGGFKEGNQAARKEIDFALLDDMIGIFCTGEECANILGVSYDTLEKRIKKEFKLSFTEYYEQKRGKGKESLRRRQFKMTAHNPAMCIWLGKQYLGQEDKAKLEHSGEITEKIVVEIKK